VRRAGERKTLFIMQPLLASGVRGIYSAITIELRANRRTAKPMASCADPRCAGISGCGKKEGGRGTLVRLSAPDDFRE
jgi:hypothetical protein